MGETELHHAMLRQASRTSLLAYLEYVRIDGSSGPRVFGQVAEEWQRRSLWPIMRACERVSGMKADYSGPRCFWRDLPAGHDKTSGIARILNGLLAFSPRNLAAGCFAKNTDQAKRIWKFMQDEARLNPWIGGLLHFTQSPSYRVRNLATGSELVIYDADFEGNAGHKLHVCVCEELTWWPEKGKLLYDQLYSRRLKIENSVFVVLGNAGVKRTWQHRAMLEARQSQEWDYYRTEGPVAGWMDPAQIERDAAQLGQSMADRVLRNIWIDQDETAYLPLATLEACEREAVRLGLTPHAGRRREYLYFAAIDAAVTKDNAALGVVGVHPSGRRELADLETIQARDHGGRIPQALIEERAAALNARFRPAWIVDPYQLEWFCQLYEGVWNLERAQFRAGALNSAMAEQVKKLLQDANLLWPPQLGVIFEESPETGMREPYTLTQEFADLVVKDMPSYGQRWDHRRQRHDDRAMVVGMAVWLSLRAIPYRPTPDAAPIIWGAPVNPGQKGRPDEDRLWKAPPDAPKLW